MWFALAYIYIYFFLNIKQKLYEMEETSLNLIFKKCYKCHIPEDLVY